MEDWFFSTDSADFAKIHLVIFLKQTLNIFCDLLSFLVLARVIFSWFDIRRNGPLIEFIFTATDAVLKPIQRLIPSSYGVLDFSPLIFLLLLSLIRNLINTFL